MLDVSGNASLAKLLWPSKQNLQQRLWQVLNVADWMLMQCQGKFYNYRCFFRTPPFIHSLSQKIFPEHHFCARHCTSKAFPCLKSGVIWMSELKQWMNEQEHISQSPVNLQLQRPCEVVNMKETTEKHLWFRKASLGSLWPCREHALFPENLLCGYL